MIKKFTLVLALAIAAVSAQDKMEKKDKMASDKMSSDKMASDKMASDKMGSDKMGTKKKGGDKMDKMEKK